MVSASELGGSVAGHAFATHSSRRVPARLIWTRDTARLESTDGFIIVIGAVQKTEQIPGGPILVHLKDGWLFEVASDAGVQSLLGLHQTHWLPRIEGWHPRLAVVSMLCLLSAFIIWRWGLGIIIAIGIAVTPASFVRGIDISNIEIIDRTIANNTTLSPETQRQVQAIFDDLSNVAPPAPWGGYHLLFRDMPEIGPNAFALPGGNIIITDQLVEGFGDPNILAGVIGHEMAHVSEKHVLEQLYRAGSTYLLIVLIAGDPGPLLQDFLREGNALLSLSYSRQDELEADRIGVTTANKAGYDGAALAKFFEAVEEESITLGPSWFSTHPSADERVKQIKNHTTNCCAETGRN